MEAANWEDIQVVNLKNNKIADIGSLPHFWPKLERLFLGTCCHILFLYLLAFLTPFRSGMNLLASIPYEIGSCTQLVELDFSHNQIQTLPLSLVQCTNLQRLHLGICCPSCVYLPIFVLLVSFLPFVRLEQDRISSFRNLH